MCPIHTETARVAKFWCKFRPLANKPGFNYVLLRPFVSLLTPGTIPGLPMAFQWGFGKKRQEEIENRILPTLHKSAGPPVGRLVSGWPLLHSALVGESGWSGLWFTEVEREAKACAHPWTPGPRSQVSRSGPTHFFNDRVPVLFPQQTVLLSLLYSPRGSSWLVMTVGSLAVNSCQCLTSFFFSSSVLSLCLITHKFVLFISSCCVISLARSRS